MRIYRKVIIVSAISMLMIIGSYRAFFGNKTEEISDVFYPVYETEELYKTTDEIISYEEDRLIASAIDAVCPNSEYLTRVAFAGMIINRKNTVGFPDDIASNIFGVSNFRDVFFHSFEKEPSEDSMMAVRDARLGFSPCSEALYFYDIDKYTGSFTKYDIIYRNGRYCFF